MVFRALLLVSIILCYVKLNYFERIKNAFPEGLKTWCPHTQFCKESDKLHTDNDSKIRFGLNEIPCCSPCSCSKDCGRSRNCCRYEDDTYRLDETLGTTCRRLDFYSRHNNVDSPYFYIVDKCPNRKQGCYNRSSNHDGFFPVYSKESGMIYLNEMCAKCHGHRDIVHFRPVAMCKDFRTSYFSDIPTGNERNRGECIERYLPPHDVDISSELCFPNKISWCNPDGNVSQADADLCESFNATFHTRIGVKYNNVYCFLCNIFSDVSPITWRLFYESCPGYSELRINNEFQFSIILQTSILNWNEHNEGQKATTKFSVWCKQSKTMDCRPVYCPEGQTYFDGRCQQLATKWFFKSLQINIHLSTPHGHTNVLVSDILPNISTNGVNDSYLTLERPGFEDWELTLLFNLDYTKGIVRYFTAFLRYKYTSVGPAQLITTTKQSFDREWTLKINNTPHTLQPRFNKYLMYTLLEEENESVYLPEDLLIGNTSHEENLIQHIIGVKPIYFKSRKTIFLTKPYFCNLIELRDSEYITRNVFGLFLLDKAKTLGDGEVIWVAEGDSERPRICLDEMAENKGQSGSTDDRALLVYMILYIIEMIFPLPI